MKKFFGNKGMTTMAVVVIVAGTVALGTAGGVVGYNVYQEKKHEEEVATFLQEIDTAQKTTIDSYNARVEQSMSELTFTDENGEVVTLDSNRNLDSMNNVINNLNAVLNDLNNDALLSQEQKDAIIAAINDKINSVNTRIEVVNEENRIEEERKAEEARQQAEAAKKASQKSSSKSSYNSGSSSSSDSESEESSGNGHPRIIDLGGGYWKYENEGGEWIEPHPEYGIYERFYDRTGVIAGAIRAKDQNPNSTVHIYGMGIDKTL
ncbi:MAG: hypothetical protein K5644_08380 [Lachnospiraceae bacterium]|nr:hypothetical protein [Lachnospiraceae bacterium]